MTANTGVLDAKSFRYQMPADAADRARQVETARRDVVAFLHGQGVPAPVTMDLEIILGEAAANVARHSLSPVMRIAVSAAAGVACLAIEDDGIGFEPSLLPPPDPDAESGRGLPLMRGLSERLMIQSRPGWTSVTARKEWPV